MIKECSQVGQQITNNEIIMKDKNHCEATHFHNEERLSDRLSKAFFKMSVKSKTIQSIQRGKGSEF